MTAAIVPRPVPTAIRNMIRIWYLTASTGGAPARICPVIMPGRLTTPAAAIALSSDTLPPTLVSQ